MKRLALASLLLVACHKPPEARKDVIAVVEASTPAVVEAPSPPPEPAVCRHAIAHGATFAQIPDATLRELIVDGAPGKKSARDCLGDSVQSENPVAPHVERFDAGDSHMAVWVMLAKELGYTDWCPGFVAVVRLEPDQLVAEGVGPETLDDNDMTHAIHLAMVDGHRALLFPHVVGTGEDGDFEAAWKAWLPDDRGALRSIGNVRSRRAMGNGSITSGNWFGNMDAKLLDGGGLRVEERWDFARVATSGEEHGARRTVVRTYSLEGGKLVASPSGDPHQ